MHGHEWLRGCVPPQILYNLLFTSLPVILVAVFDQDLGQDFCMDHPEAYAVGRRGERFDRKLFWYNILDGVWQGTVCFLFAIAVYGWSTSGVWAKRGGRAREGRGGEGREGGEAMVGRVGGQALW